MVQYFDLGGFAEQALVHENNLVAVDQAVPFEQACLLGCAVVTGAGAVINSAGVRVGDTVAIIGCGGVGLSAVQAARLAGALRIIAVDINHKKLELAQRMGATDAINPGDGDPVEDVLTLTGGVDHAFEASGRETTAMQAFEILAPGGTAYLIGLQPPDSVFQVPGNSFLAQRCVRGVIMGASNFKVDIPMLVAYSLQARFNLEDLVSQTISLDSINDGYEALAGGDIARSVVVFEPDGQFDVPPLTDAMNSDEHSVPGCGS